MLDLVSVEFALLKHDLCGTRNDSICSYLIAQDCDALVISEFRRNTPGDQLIEALRQAGFSHIHHNNTDSKQNTVMLAQSQ